MKERMGMKPGSSSSSNNYGSSSRSCSSSSNISITKGLNSIRIDDKIVH